MHRRTFAILICLLLAACGTVEPTPTARPRAEQIAQATQVAAAITATAQVRAMPTATATATVTPTATATRTAAPPTATVAATATRRPSATATPRPSAPSAASAVLPGAVLFADDFTDTASGWPDGANQLGAFGYLRGAYHMRIEQPGRSVHVTNTRFQGADVSVEATVTVAAGTTHDNGMGLTCRVQASNADYYAFILYASGHYKIDRVANNASYLVVSSLADPRLKPLALGDARSHRLRADCVGDTQRLWVDGALMAEMRDTAYVAGGVGFETCTCGGSLQDVLFEDFMVRALAQP